MSKTWAVLLALPAITCIASKVNEATWILGGGGVSCSQVCENRGGCHEDAWPTSEAEFGIVQQMTNFQCEGVQAGGAEYDPSTDGHYCGWATHEEEHVEKETKRCDVLMEDPATRRFCPCVTDKEL
eukprot:gnl/MRDRNA2_/MRDRNA2_29464_c0_seq1.p1 gnl/MRDRNA2_/MRDRNA2_29464_c0~~gnl/MRDRNA2_/MRDRNA2_29464_c0_seq1.p1  ORF type:complete len:126 (-),score=28.92 gnl/MRDRNA2_/MRDRNA2_29464_c0_seq1:72-449(-)